VTNHLQHGHGAENVGVHEVISAGKRAIHMGLGCEVHYGVAGRDEFADQRLVADITVHEGEPLQRPKVAEVRRVPCIGELVKDHDLPIRAVRCKQPSEVGPDKPGPTGYQNAHASPP